MKKSFKCVFILIIISLIVTSCSSNYKKGANNSQGKKVQNTKKDKAEDLKVNTNLIFNSDGSDTTLEDLKKKSIEDKDGKTRIHIDTRFDIYGGVVDSQEYDGISIEEIIKKTLDQANRKDNYTIQFQGVSSRTTDGVDEFNNKFSNLHQQDSEGNFRVIHEENDLYAKKQKVGTTVYNGEEYICYELTDSNPDSFIDSLPSGLTGKEAFELIKEHHYNNSEKDDVIKGKDLEELTFDYNYIVNPAIENSVFYMDIFKEGVGGGSFVRFEDGYKDVENKLFDNVYHLLFIDRNEDPNLSKEFEFFIDKDTYLITFQYGKYMGSHYESKLTYYDTEYDNREIDFAFSDMKTGGKGFVSINELNNSRNFKFNKIISEKLTNKDELITPKDFSIIINDKKELSKYQTVEEIEKILEDPVKKELGEDEFYEDAMHYSFKKDGIEVLYVDPMDGRPEIIKYIKVYDPRHSTYRGLRVGDSYNKMMKLYKADDLIYKSSDGAETTFFYDRHEETDYNQLIINIDNLTNLISWIGIGSSL